MSHALFVTGTDTGVGKTLASCALVHALRTRGHSVAAMKPLASGAVDQGDGVLRNADVDALLACSSPGLTRRLANPYCFAEPAAPEIAALLAGAQVRLEPMLSAFDALTAQYEHLVVEGVGGWEAPLAATLMQADFCRARALPVVLVVGLRLGCINHARLALRAIIGDGLPCLGWIANTVDPQFAHAAENIAILSRDLPVPLLGVLPHAAHPDPVRFSGLLDLTRLPAQPSPGTL